MEIHRRNFRFNRILNMERVVADSTLFYMDQVDINDDENVRGEHIGEREGIWVFKNKEEAYNRERYCYVKTTTHIGGDGHTKAIFVDKIITDGNLIINELFVCLFTILLQQEDNEYPNRIIIGNINKCFRRNITETAKEIGNYIYNLYNTYTSDLVPTYSTS